MKYRILNASFPAASPNRCRLLTSLLGVAGCFAVAAQPALSGETGSDANAAQPPAEKSATITEGASGMTIYIDPQTGAIRQSPAPGTVPLQLTPQERNALSTSHDGLVAVPSSVPGGGVKLNLQGRFQSPSIATIDANGKLKTQHLEENPYENPLLRNKK